MHMAQLRKDYDQFVNQDTEVIVLSPEGINEFKALWRMFNHPFIGLPDPHHSVLKLYGQEIDLFKLGRMPAQVLIDKQGIARFVHYGKSMSDIPKTQEMLELLDEINNKAERSIVPV